MRRAVISLAALHAALRRCRARSVVNSLDFFNDAWFRTSTSLPYTGINSYASAMRTRHRGCGLHALFKAARSMTKMQVANATPDDAWRIYFMPAALLLNYFLAALVT
jgi:hypothetical protein